MKKRIASLLDKHGRLGIASQEGYERLHLYSIITHSTAIEGSTVTDIENQLLFDEGLTPQKRPLVEQLMNLDLKRAYDKVLVMAAQRQPLSISMLRQLASCVMRNTGAVYNTIAGSFDSSAGDLRLVNVTAGYGGRSYVNYLKVRQYLEQFCASMNQAIDNMASSDDVFAKYQLTFDMHYQLVTIHPWVDGNGRMARLVMNNVQCRLGLWPLHIDSSRKADYIKALVDSSETDNLEPFRTFMFAELERQLADEIANFEATIDHDPFATR